MASRSRRRSGAANSHLIRSCLTLLRRSEEQLLKRARKTQGLVRPTNHETIALAEFTVPGFQGAEDSTAAKANVRAAIPAVEAYCADNTGKGASACYAGMTVAALHNTYDPAIDATKLTITSANATTYCIESTVASTTWHKAGPGADIESGRC